MESEFGYSQSVKIFFGAGKFDQLGSLLGELGFASCVLVCDPYFEKKALELKEKLPAVRAVWAGVEPNPQLSGAEAAAKLAKEFSADVLVGVGGGSAMDTAKFAAAICRGSAEASAYYDGKPFEADRPAVLTVPTTAGTGSEVTQVSVMNRGEQKKTINDPALLPLAAVIDPLLTLSVPPRTTMITGLDALSHALEGYWSINHQPITDLYAIEAVRLVLENLETAYRNGQNIVSRTNMAYAALLAGMAFAQPKTAGCHACSYPLAQDYHLPHGEACAFTLPSFVRINADARLEELCHRAGLTGTEELAERIDALRSLAGLKTRLSEIGCTDIEALARDCAAHPLMKNNPVKMDEAMLADLFRALA